MLAFTNKDVKSLNETARQMMRDQGQIIGQDFRYETHKINRDDFGKETITQELKTFAKGDRLLFIRNNNSLGVKNGTLGTILSLNSHKIMVRVDDSGKEISFAPKLYPFIDNGWATTIHKAQGVTVDHVKKLASIQEYRNVAYVGMSRHRHSIEVFGSNLDFSREEQIVDRLSRIQEKLSGFDYLDSNKIYDQLKTDAKILWHEKKLQQGRDLWTAVKVTARSAIDQLRDRPKDKIPEPASSFEVSEEKRSQDLFKFRESIPAARVQFEEKNRDKYHQACEFFEFRERYGRAPTPEDRPLISVMGEQLTRLAGRLFQEHALKEGSLPKPSDISKQAYAEFALRPHQEKALADRLIQEYQIPSQTAQILSTVMLSQQDISGQVPTKSDETAALKLTEFARTRAQDIKSDQSESLTSFRLTRELTQMQAHVLRHGTLPEGEKLQKIQESARLETQKMEVKVQQVVQVQRAQTVKQGMRM
jgi:hypothetical protein